MGEGALGGTSGRRAPALAAALLAAIVLAMSVHSSEADAAAATCAGSFRVLHNDHIGALSVPAGNYQITVRNPARLSCAAASKLFTRFLEDFDGVLPSPWILQPGAKFSHGVSTPVGFSIKRFSAGGGGNNIPGGGGKHPQSGRFCPGTFRVVHRDHIGRLSLPAGPYYVILLQTNGLTCAQASAQFTRFLDDVNGVLPAPWILEPQTARFRRGHGKVGFRVKPATAG